MSAADLFAGLDDLDWSRVAHAYGAAVDVPRQLRALAAESAEARESAMWELWGNIHHQGTVYEATAQAVPFLARIAANEGPQPRAEILLLLSAIARSTAPGWARGARDAVESAARSMLADLMADPNKGVRIAAAALCSSFVSMHARVRAVAVAGVRESASADEKVAYQLAGLLAGVDAAEVGVDDLPRWSASAILRAGFELADGVYDAFVREISASPDEPKPLVADVLDDIASRVIESGQR